MATNKSNKVGASPKTSTASKTATATRTATATKTSTEAYTQGNVTVTGGAGAGSTTVHIGGQLPSAKGKTGTSKVGSATKPAPIIRQSGSHTSQR